MSLSSQLQQRADFLENNCAFLVFIRIFGEKKDKAFCTLRHLLYYFQWQLGPKPAQITRRKYKTQICYLPPILFHFTSWKGYTGVTSCILREMDTQSAINLSVCMCADIQRVNKGSGMVMRRAVTSHACFHRNYWSAVTVIQIPVD
jgi:hypothetical protein